MRRKVFLHGRLKEFCPNPIVVDSETVAEAIEIATNQIPEMNRGPRTRVKVAGVETQEDLFRTDLDEVHIVPAMSGAKEGGVLQIVIGATLIVAGVFMGGSTWPAAFIMTGTSMVIGGAMQLLMPTPQADLAEGDPEASKYLGSPKNTVKIGTRIPLLFGTDQAYGHFLSFDIDAKDVAV